MDPRRLPPLQHNSGGSLFPPPSHQRSLPHLAHPNHPLPLPQPPPPIHPHWGASLPPIVQDHLHPSSRHRPPPPLDHQQQQQHLPPKQVIPVVPLLNTSALPRRQDSSVYRYDDHGAHTVPTLSSSSVHTLQVASSTTAPPPSTSTASQSTAPNNRKRTNNPPVDPMPPTSDFVKKLFRMLEDNRDEHLVSWSPNGDSFTVKDMNEFTKVILPRMFKHSNFASFVRQLNKYDFHKIKNEETPGDSSQSWTFRHPDFQRSNYAALENIKRKVPATRKSNSAASANNTNTAGGAGVLGGGIKRSSSPLPLEDSPHGGAPESPAPSYGAPSPAAAAGQTSQLSYSVPTNANVNGMVASNMPVQHSAIPYPSSSTSNSPSHPASTTAIAPSATTNVTATSNVVYGLDSQLSELRETLTRQVRVLTAQHDDLRFEHMALKKAYENTERELDMFRHTTRDQDVLIRQLAGWFSIQHTARTGLTPAANDSGPPPHGQIPAASSSIPSSQAQSQTSIPPQHQQYLLSQQSQSSQLNTQSATAPPAAEAEAGAPQASSSSAEPGAGPDAFLQTHEAARMVAPPFRVTNNYLNSANAHIATAVLSNGADEHSLAEISLRRMNLMSERAMQAGMQFSMVTATQQQRQAGNEVQGTGTGTAATTTTTTEIPMTEPKPVLVGMTREVALQRLQDLARVSSSDLTGVTASKGLRSQPKSPIKTKREQGLDDSEGHSHRDNSNSTDGESDDDGGPRVYASQHAQRIPTGAGLKARNFTALSASNSASASAAPLSPTNSLIPMPRGGGGTLSQGDNYRGLSVLTVGHLVPRPFLPDDGMASGMPTSAANGALSNAGGPGTSADRGGPNGWPMAMSNGSSGPVPGVGMGMNVAMDPMLRIPSPPAASPPSLSATDPRPLVHAYPPPTSPPPSLSTSMPSASGGGAMTSPRQTKLRVRRSTYVPGWAVPPRVLLVEDDLVSRRLSSKFLQVSGCEIGVAVDGLGAVSKMELEKYDLVLMDIVMPKLDGISATSMIRRFDPMTPIISMTSNSKPSEILTYYSSGMNDILPKPFTRDGLLKMLEKHLMHLKHIQDFTASIPRSLGEGITLPEGFVYSDATPSPSMLTGATPSLQITNGDSQLDNSFPSASASATANNDNMPAVTTSSNYTHISSADPANGHNALFFPMSLSGGGADDGSNANGGLINPLHGLGLNVEQYPSLLQNLLGMSSEALNAMELDPNLLNDIMLDGPGDSMLTSLGARPAPTKGVPASGPTAGPTTSSPTHKRPRDDDVDGLGTNGIAAKRSRFEVVD